MKWTIAVVVVATIFWTEAAARSLPFHPSEESHSRILGNFVPVVSSLFKILDNDFKNHLTFGEIEEGNVAAAVSFFAGHFGKELAEFRISSYHTSGHNGVTHVYLKQVINGIDVVNSLGNINILQSGQIHSIGSSIYNGPKPIQGDIKAKHSASDAVRELLKALQIGLSGVLIAEAETGNVVVKGSSIKENVPAKMGYLQMDEGKTLRLVWGVEVDMGYSYFKAYVDAENNKILAVKDYVSHASYNVLPFGIIDPRDGDVTLVTNPENLVASPLGWHSTGPNDEHTVTIGNNVYAQDNHYGEEEYISKPRPSGGEDLFFNSPLDLTSDPLEYVNSSITQLFYMTNVLHDIFYMYGFNEVAGNFQEFNFELGGAGSDAVIADAQYAGELGMYNGAAFVTFPDGSNSRLMMTLWDFHEPHRDSVFDSVIVIHEYVHGVSTRLTGGRMEVECLWGDESVGMGEGYGDILGTIFQTNENTTREAVYDLATYVGIVGARKFPYSTNMSINPSTYRFTVEEGYEGAHAKGEIWASLLYEVYWNLVDKHGFDTDWSNTDPENQNFGGNVIFTQLLIDGMKLQPCDPIFTQARDAILEADRINNQGNNIGALWSGFAKRGLGIAAEYPGIESFELPTP